MESIIISIQKGLIAISAPLCFSVIGFLVVTIIVSITYIVVNNSSEVDFYFRAINCMWAVVSCSVISMLILSISLIVIEPLTKIC